MRKRQNAELIRKIKKHACENNIPIECAFELTARCNFDCKMCYVHELDSPGIRKEELSTQQWISIFDQAVDAGMMFAILSGGECLLRQDFKELYLHLWKRVNVTVNTNASMFTDDLLAFFKTYRPFQIQISVYGNDDNSYKDVTGIPAFEKVQKTVDKLIDAGIPVKIVFTVSKFNFANCRELFQFAKNRNVEYSVTAELITPREGITREEYMLSLDEYIRVLKISREVFSNKPLEIPSGALPETGRPIDCIIPSDQPFIRCKAGRGAAFITWKGHMLICASLMDISVDILKEGFRSAWEKINEFACAARMPMECVGCPYDRYCSKCPAIRAGSLSSDHCKQSHCASVKACFENGLFTMK